jgi:adenine-specific DNA-methyltransferase
MIKYLGSKRLLLPLILEVVSELEPKGSVIDLFSGTSRVGHALKGAGYQVFSNDLNTYAATLATCYVQADLNTWGAIVQDYINELNELKGQPGYFTEKFCIESQFFQPHNGARVDAIREQLERDDHPKELKAILLTSLMEAADRVDSTCGIQMAYLKQWASRSYNDLELRLPKILPRAKSGKGRAYHSDAIDAVEHLSADIAYLDPPYNQHKYLGNYHIWETLVRWDKPEAYGIARKRVDVRSRHSSFNAKRKIASALKRVIERLDVKHIIVSFSDEGYITKEEMVELLSSRGEVKVIARDYKRYVGAQIGIYNPSGEQVGEVSHLKNTEYLFVVSPLSPRLT